MVAALSASLGYFKDPEKSARTFMVIDGVPHSLPGDWAKVAADGSLILLGRGSNCINTGGEKVFPEEVEEAVKANPAVYDCLVVGVPDERFGERVVAVASLQPGASADEGSIIESSADHIARYKLPKQVIIVERVQRAPNGKADYPWAREVAAASAPSGPRRDSRRRLGPPRSTDELDAADRDLDEIGVAVVTGVLDAAATADVRARLLDAADRSDAVGIPTRGYAFDFDEKNRRVFMLFAWDPVFVELIQHPLALRYVRRTIGDFLISNFSANITGPGAGGMHLHADQYYVPAAVGSCAVRGERGVAARRLHRRERRDARDPGQPSRAARLHGADRDRAGRGTGGQHHGDGRPAVASDRARTARRRCTAPRCSATTSNPGSGRRSTGTPRCRRTSRRASIRRSA